MTEKPRVLLHICCAPCAVIPARALAAEGFEVTGLFYNPNIHPAVEYARRRDTLRAFARQLGLARVIFKDADYAPQEWMRRVAFREDNRCFFCYQMRLERTAHIARSGNYAFFSSTLLYSKRQKHDQIAAIARDLGGEEHKSRFLYRDFRTDWQEGIELSKALGMYRQDHCGCLLSETERHQGRVRG